MLRKLLVWIPSSLFKVMAHPILQPIIEYLSNVGSNVLVGGGSAATVWCLQELKKINR